MYAFAFDAGFDKLRLTSTQIFLAPMCPGLCPTLPPTTETWSGLYCRTSARVARCPGTPFVPFFFDGSLRFAFLYEITHCNCRKPVKCHCYVVRNVWQGLHSINESKRWQLKSLNDFCSNGKCYFFNKLQCWDSVADKWLRFFKSHGSDVSPTLFQLVSFVLFQTAVPFQTECFR